MDAKNYEAYAVRLFEERMDRIVRTFREAFPDRPRKKMTRREEIENRRWWRALIGSR
jgi:hypothetical protein